jgi:heparosan-N-sulfate-glucuronate 5-epimerase
VVSKAESRADPAVGVRVAGRRAYPGFFSSAKTFALPVGGNVSAGRLGGYYIDFSLKAHSPDWPPRWFKPSGRHVSSIQWGLGCFERYLDGDGDRWLAGAIQTAEYLVAIQVRGGAREGGWPHHTPMPHTYRLDVPWLSAMAQGEGASLLVRAHQVTDDERFADAARRALRPLTIPVAAGGVRAELDDAGFFPEEYPTDPPSFVLNGGIFALWGYYDVAMALDLAEARQEFEQSVDTLARNIDRWDTGSWSRYDLFPHRVVNVASSSYHVLHINQLRAMQLVCPREELEAAATRFEGYWASRANRVPAFVRKAMFRLVVPRNRLLARMSLSGRREGRESAA